MKTILKKALEQSAGRKFDYQTKKDFDKMIKEDTYFSVIFSHEFAKAFWGEEQEHFSKWGCCKRAWKGHITIMVLEEDPINYLEQFIKN